MLSEQGRVRIGSSPAPVEIWGTAPLDGAGCDDASGACRPCVSGKAPVRAGAREVFV